MKLQDKGHYAPPPTLRSRAAQRVVDTLASWDGVQARTHWFLGDETQVDGADFYLGDEELGHVHLDATAHVALPPRVVDALIQHGLGERFPWGRGFVLFRIVASTVDHALWLFELSRARRSGESIDALLARVRAAAKPASAATTAPG